MIAAINTTVVRTVVQELNPPATIFLDEDGLPLLVLEKRVTASRRLVTLVVIPTGPGGPMRNVTQTELVFGLDASVLEQVAQ